MLSQGPACPQGCPGPRRVAGTTHTTCYRLVPVPAMGGSHRGQVWKSCRGRELSLAPCSPPPAKTSSLRSRRHTTPWASNSMAPPSGPARGLRRRLSTINQPRLAGLSRQSGQHVDPTLQGLKSGSSPSGTARQAVGQAQMPVNRAESLLSMHSLHLATLSMSAWSVSMRCSPSSSSKALW